MFLSSGKELLYLALSVGWSVGLSQKFKCPIFQHIIANKYLFHLGDDGRRRRSRGGGGEGGGGEGGGVDGGGGSKYIIVKVQTIPELIAYPCLFLPFVAIFGVGIRSKKHFWNLLM